MKIGFLGCGKMAMALVRGMLRGNKFDPADLLLASRRAVTAVSLAEVTGASALPRPSELAAQSDVVVLCVKPGDAAAALKEIHAEMRGKLLISVMAGVSLAKLQELTPSDARHIRAMPNMPAMIGLGATAISAAANSNGDDLVLATNIFQSVGRTWILPEKLMDAVTGVSGSGPAYIYLIIESLADGGVLAGLPRDVALAMATQTVIGAAEMVERSEQHPAVLKDAVASPGGTTIAALEALEIGGLRATLIAAVRAAAQRSKELSA